MSDASPSSKRKSLVEADRLARLSFFQPDDTTSPESQTSSQAPPDPQVPNPLLTSTVDFQLGIFQPAGEAPSLGGSPSSSSGSSKTSVEALLVSLPTRDNASAMCETYYRVRFFIYIFSLFLLSRRNRKLTTRLFLFFCDQNGAWMYGVLPREYFFASFFDHVYSNSSDPSHEISNQKLAIVFLMIALGYLFDLNSPPRQSIVLNFL